MAEPVPQPGAVLDGYRFNGGDPSRPESWQKLPQPGDVQDGYEFKGGDPGKPESWQPLPQGRGAMRTVDDVGRSLARGASFGWADEIAAAGNAAFKPVANAAQALRDRLGVTPLIPAGPQSSDAPSFSERYRENLAGERRTDAEGNAASPYLTTGGEIAGAVAGAAAMMPRALMSAGSTYLGTAARGAGGGALAGGAMAAGDSEREGLELLQDAATGAGVGGAIGGAANVALMGAGRGAQKIAASPVGQKVGANVVAPTLDAAADVADKLAGKTSGGDLSAAATGGGIVKDSRMARIAENLRLRAERAKNPAEQEALRKVLQSLDRDKLTATALRSKADDLAEAGVDPMLFQAAGENTQQRLKTVATMPGEAKSLVTDAVEGWKGEQGGRIAGSLDKLAGRKNFYQTDDAIVAARDKASKPLYEKMLEVDVQLTPKMAVMVDDDIARKGLARGHESQRIEAAREGVKYDPLKANTMRQLDAIKRGLDEIIDGERNAVTGKLSSRGRDVDLFRKSFLKEIDDNINPLYGEARAAWAGPTRSREVLRMGRDLAFKDDPEITAAAIRAMTPGDRELLRLGLRRELEDLAKNTPDGANKALRIFNTEGKRERIQAAFDNPSEFAKFANTMKREIEAFKAAQDVLPRSGSQTARNLADMADSAQPLDIPTNTSGVVMTAIRKVANFLAPGPGNEQVRNEFARMMLAKSPQEQDRIIQALITRAQLDAVTRAGTVGSSGYAAGQTPLLGPGPGPLPMTTINAGRRGN